MIPNPRDRKRRDVYKSAQVAVLRTTQFVVFALAILILAMMVLPHQ